MYLKYITIISLPLVFCLKFTGTMATYTSRRDYVMHISLENAQSLYISALSIMLNQQTFFVTSLVSNAKLVVLDFQVKRSLVRFWPRTNNR